MSAMAAGPAALDRQSGVPLWAQMLDDLRSRVGRGEFDEWFPSEMQLVAEYDVSRNTVRSVLSRLRGDGVVLAGRGRRPRLNPEIRQPLGAFYSLYESIEAAGLGQRSVVRRLRRTTSASVAKRLGLASGTGLVVLERLRFAGEEPLALDHVYLPEAVGEVLFEVDLTAVSVYELLAERRGVHLTSGHEVLSAAIPTAAQRQDLAIPEGVALLAIERSGYSDGVPVEWRRTLVRADRFSLVSDFSDQAQPSGAGGALRLGPLGGSR